MKAIWFISALLSPVLLFCSDKADSALQRLVEGNRRFASGNPLHPDQDVQRRENIAKQQQPFAVVVGCSDSRVAPETIFDQGLGDIFVVRVAGNVVGPIELDSIEFSADALHTPLIVVLGHEKCGAVNAVLKTPNLKEIQDIAPLIRPAVELSKDMPGDRLTNAIKANVRLVVEHLKSTPLLNRLVIADKLKIIGAYYNLKDGTVILLP